WVGWPYADCVGHPVDASGERSRNAKCLVGGQELLTELIGTCHRPFGSGKHLGLLNWSLSTSAVEWPSCPHVNNLQFTGDSVAICLQAPVNNSLSNVLGFLRVYIIPCSHEVFSHAGNSLNGCWVLRIATSLSHGLLVLW